MNSTRQFQALVVASALLYLAWVTLPLLISASSLEMESILSWQGHEGSSWVQNPWFYLSTGAGKLVASVGLILFLPWGRWLFLLVLIVVFISIPFSGVSVAPPIDNIVGFLLTLSEGAILAFSFSLPLNRKMAKEV